MSGEDAVTKVLPAKLEWPRIASFLTVLFGFGSVGLGLGVISPLLVPITASTGNEQLSQTLVVMPFLGLAVTSLAAGWIADRVGARGALCAGAVVFASAGLVGYFDPPAPFMLAACFIVGASTAVMAVCAALLLGQNYDGEARARVIGYAMAFAGFMASASVALSGVIADRIEWRASFLQFVVAGVLILVFALTSLSGTNRAPADGEAPAGPLKLALLAPVTSFVAVGFLAMMVTSSTGTQVPLLLRDEGVHVNTVISTILALQGLSAMFGSFIYGTLQTLLGRFGVAVLAIALIVTGAGVISVAHVPLMFGVGCASFGLSMGLLLPWLIEGLYAHAPLAVRGHAVGIFNTAGYIGAFCNPFLARPIRDAVGLHGLYFVVAVATVVVGGAGLARAYGQGRARVRAEAIGAAKAVSSEP
jgi:MFS family permease